MYLLAVYLLGALDLDFHVVGFVYAECCVNC